MRESTPASAFVDLCHTIHPGMITYPGMPGPIVTDFLSREASAPHYAEGTTFQIGQITLVANTGTYLDSPFHRYADAPDISQLDLEQMANLPGLVLRLPGSDSAQPRSRAFTEEDFAGLDVRGKAVLLATDWDLRWRTEGYMAADHPYLAATVRGLGTFPLLAFAILDR